MNEIDLLKQALDRKVIIGNEKKIPDFAVYSDKEISGFFGPVRWLSNFWRCPNGISYMGTKFPSVENAYQAAKWPKEEHKLFVHISCADAKKLGQEAPLDPNWDSGKFDLMAALVMMKFSNDDNLKNKLIETGNKHLEERNYWNDVYWGTDPKGVGENKLGLILMEVREMLKHNII